MSDDLLAGIGDPSASGEVVDLLANLDDTGAPAWVPETAGEGIQGKLVSLAEQDDDYNPGETVPVWTVELATGDKLRVVGFASVLRREMKAINERGAKPGDTVAVKYFGEKELTKGKFKGKPYKHYGAAHKAV